MADWKIFLNDRGLASSVACASCHADFPITNINQQNPQSLTKFTAASPSIVYTLGGSYPIGAVGIANHNLQGGSISVNVGVTNIISDTMPTGDCVFFKSDGTDVTDTEVTIVLGSANTKYVGAISVFPQAVDAGIFEAGEGAPRYPIVMGVPLNNVRTQQSAGSGIYRQRYVGQSITLDLEINAARFGASNAGKLAWDAFKTYGHQGFWVTTDEYSSGIPAYYVYAESSERVVRMPDSRSNLNYTLIQLPY